MYDKDDRYVDKRRLMMLNMTFVNKIILSEHRTVLSIEHILVPTAVTSSSFSSSPSSTPGQPRTVESYPINGFSTISSTTSSNKKKHRHLNNLFLSANSGHHHHHHHNNNNNKNNNNNNNNNNDNNNSSQHVKEPTPSVSYFIEQKRSSRAPIQIIEHDLGVIDNKPDTINHCRRTRTKSLLPLSTCATSAFDIVQQPTNHQKSIREQQQEYVALLKMLKMQEIQIEEQGKELKAKQRGSDKRYTIRNK
jgi:hypothetical protein